MIWSDWTKEDLRSHNPYIDWFKRRDGDQASNSGGFGRGDLILENLVGLFEALQEDVKPPSSAKSDAEVALPAFTKSKDFNSSAVSADLPAELLDDLTEDTVIVGLIDTGIPLGHRSTRFRSGETRIISAWQQNADPKLFPESAFAKQPTIPFGRELYSNDINRLLEEYSDGDLANSLDQEGFDQATGVVDFHQVRGHREMAARAAHGAHTINRAAAIDPLLDESLAKDIRIMVVNLPNRSTVGLSGTFLETFVTQAVKRIVQLTDQLWDNIEKRRLAEKWHSRGFPILINFSFGKQAGPRDASGEVASLVRELNKTRSFPYGLRRFDKFSEEKIKQKHVVAGREPVFLIVPAGNDNLLRGNARLEIGAGETTSLDWRTLPDDHSSNYVEIWSEPASGRHIDTKKVLAEISLQPPVGPKMSFAAPKNGEMRILNAPEAPDTELLAAVYCQVFHPNLFSEGEKKKSEYHRVRYTICTVPTYAPDGAPTMQAGKWTIELKNNAKQKAIFYANVQTDQSATPDASTGRRGYFDDPGYERFDHTTGRLIDTYRFPPTAHSDRKNKDDDEKHISEDDLDVGSPVMRHNTMNALAIDELYTVVTAGHRHADGRPAPYSGSGRFNKTKDGYDTTPGRGQGAPSVSLVTDDGPAHRGILSAGAKDGSAVAMQGTSFAASQLTNILARAAVETKHSFDPKYWMKKQKETGGLIKTEEQRFPYTKDYPRTRIDPEKAGWGRLPANHYRGLPRRGDSWD